MATNEKKQKSLLKYIFIFVTLILVVLLARLAWAKYQTVIGGDTNTQIAEWHFDLQNCEGKSATVKEINFPMTRTDGNKSVADGKLAPGTSGEFKMIVDTTNTDVLTLYTININLTDCPTNLKFYTDSTMQQELPKVKIDERQENGETIKIHQLSISRFLSLDEVNGKHPETLYWQWPMETGNTEQDRYKNNLEDSKWIGKEKMTMDISAIGEQVLEAPSQIAIRSINVENSNGSTSTATINKEATELADGINANIVLGSNTTATSTINVSMTNLSDEIYYFYDAKLVSVDGEEINSDSIDYEIIGLTKSRNTTIGTELIPGSTVDFKIVFKYNNDVILNSNNIMLNAIISFEYRKAYSITYINFERISNYPKKVIDGGTIDIQFDSNKVYMDIKVISDGKLLIRDSIYTYNDSSFHMENVKSSLEITKTEYTGVKDGLTSFATKENSNNSTFGYYNSYFNNELQYSEDGALICDGKTLVRTMVNQKDFNGSYSISVTVNGDADQSDTYGYSTSIIAIADSEIVSNFICFIGFYKNHLVCYSFYAGDGKQGSQNFSDDIGFSSIDISEYSNKTMNIQVTGIKGGETKIYINGKLKKNNISGNSEVIFDSINIGDLRPNRKEYFLGKIYDVATYNKILTEEEINENWLNARDRYNIKYE